MSWAHLLLMLVVAAIVTPISVRLIPHARQSPAFNRLLWGGTFAIAFLGAWLAPAFVGSWGPDWTLGGVSLVPIAIGAGGGALALNLLLWVLDRLEHPEEGDDDPRA